MVADWIQTKKIFNFTTLIEKLKKMERFKGQFYWRDYPELGRYESVAAHTWRLGILILLFKSRLSQKINIEKVLTMALVHDLAEIIAGDESAMGETGTGEDSHAFNRQRALKKHAEEEAAAKKLFGMLPAEEGEKLLDLWSECEGQKSFEAKVVKALDRIECMLQVLEYRQGHMFPEHLEFTIRYGLGHSDVDPAIAEFGQLVADELKKKFKPFKKSSPPRL